MNIETLYPSHYLRAADLQGKKVPLKIEKVQIEDIGGEDKPVLYFRDKQKGLVLNKTNATQIASSYGNESDEWYDKPLTLYPTRVSFQGRLVDAIRVEAPAPAMTESDGDIPF